MIRGYILCSIMRITLVAARGSLPLLAQVRVGTAGARPRHPIWSDGYPGNRSPVTSFRYVRVRRAQIAHLMAVAHDENPVGFDFEHLRDVCG